MQKNNTISKRERWLLLYYGILLVVLTSWRNIEMAPPMTLRLVFLALVLIPAFFRKDVLPIALTCFLSIALNGYAYSYMPTMLYIYAGIVLVLSSVMIDRNSFQLPTSVLILTFYATVVNVIMGGRPMHDFTCSFAMFLLFYLMIGRDDSSFYDKMCFAYAVVTLVLSLLFLTAFDQFAVRYSALGSDLERSGWTDPNYFGTVLGIGTVFSVLQLYNRKDLTTLVRIFYIVVIGVSVIALVTNASRGSIVAVAGSLAVVMLFSRARPVYKLLTLVAAVVFIIFIYNSGYMDLLIYRSMDDTADTAGGRTTIWINKLNVWINGGLFNVIFGTGIEAGYLVTGKNLGFHNDFVAALVDFGIIGFVVFMSALLRPIVTVFRRKTANRVTVYTLSAYLFLTSMSLEPLTSGRFPYVMLLLSIYIIANQGVMRKTA